MPEPPARGPRGPPVARAARERSEQERETERSEPKAGGRVQRTKSGIQQRRAPLQPSDNVGHQFAGFCRVLPHMDTGVGQRLDFGRRGAAAS